MAELPRGTVASLFTNVEGSTFRWRAKPTAMRRAHARHGALPRGRVAPGDHGVATPRAAGGARAREEVADMLALVDASGAVATGTVRAR